MHMPHKLAPAQDLPNETLAARQRKIRRLNVTNHATWQQAVEVQEARDARMEERRRRDAHGVFIGPEVGQALGQRPAPQLLGVLLCGR